MKSDKKFSIIDEYHSSFPKDTEKKLEVFRRTIREVVPDGKEVISYNAAAFKVN